MSKRSRHSSSGPTVNINDLVQALRQYNQNPGPPQNQPLGGMGGGPNQMNLGGLAGLLGGGQMGQGGMPQIPGMGQGMPQMPGMGQGMPQIPGMGQGMPQMPGMGQGMMPGMSPMSGMGMPGISQMPGHGAPQPAQNAAPAAQEKNSDKMLLKNLFDQILLALKEK